MIKKEAGTDKILGVKKEEEENEENSVTIANEQEQCEDSSNSTDLGYSSTEETQEDEAINLINSPIQDIREEDVTSSTDLGSSNEEEEEEHQNVSNNDLGNFSIEDMTEKDVSATDLGNISSTDLGSVSIDEFLSPALRTSGQDHPRSGEEDSSAQETSFSNKRRRLEQVDNLDAKRQRRFSPGKVFVVAEDQEGNTVLVEQEEDDNSLDKVTLSEFM